MVTDNVFAALRHRDRVCYIDLCGLTSSLLEGLAAEITQLVWHPGYFSPEAMVTGLSALPRLEHLDLEFLSSRSQSNRESRGPPLQTRIVLHALRKLNFKGVNEYLEDLVAQINAPLLRNVYITLFNQLAFDVSQFSQFIGRAENLNAFNQAEVVFYHLSVGIRLHP
jgi:hypothetical protein